MNKKFPLFDIYWDDNDIEAVNKIITRGSFWAAGPEINEFEKKIAEYFNVKYCVSFNSGTSAQYALLLALGINSGEVIVPSFSFISTANCVYLAGADPVFAEIETQTFGLDVKDVIRRINPSTKAIIPVHYGGNICKDIFALKELAKQHNLFLIEDNAESFGATMNGIKAGTIGDAAFLSFCQNKIITTGEGGAVITNNQDIYEKLKLIRSHGRVENPSVNYFEDIGLSEYISVGHNFRMSSLNAALGISQLNKIDKILSLRRKVASIYNELFSQIDDVIQLNNQKETKPVYQLYTIMLKNPETRIKLQKWLLNSNIYSKIYFSPIHMKEFYRKKYDYKEGSFPNTERLSNSVLTLPMSLNFEYEDIHYIVSKISEFYKMGSIN